MNTQPNAEQIAELEKAATEYSQNMWGIYYNDKHQDSVIEETFGELTEKDFIAGALSPIAAQLHKQPWVDALKKLQEKYDENGYDLPADIQVQRIDQYIDSVIEHYKNLSKQPWISPDTPPEFGKEIILFREDVGAFCGFYGNLAEFLSDQQMESFYDAGMTEEEAFMVSYWGYVFGSAPYRLEGSELPTGWQHLPSTSGEAVKMISVEEHERLMCKFAEFIGIKWEYDGESHWHGGDPRGALYKTAHLLTAFKAKGG